MIGSIVALLLFVAAIAMLWFDDAFMRGLSVVPMVIALARVACIAVMMLLATMAPVWQGAAVGTLVLAALGLTFEHFDLQQSIVYLAALKPSRWVLQRVATAPTCAATTDCDAPLAPARRRCVYTNV